MATHFPNLPYSFARAPSVLFCAQALRTTVTAKRLSNGRQLYASQSCGRLATDQTRETGEEYLPRRDLC